MIRTLYLAFFLSGVAGLVYETMWSRYLALFVGHSAYAQVIVLTIFLGGLSVGALLVGQVSEKVRRPLLAYAAVELVVGVAGLFFHDVFGFLTGAVYQGMLPSMAGTAATALRWTVAGAMILPQSVLLGTTFPLMSAALLRRAPDRPGRVLGLLYFVNSLGAAVGAIFAGFFLVAAVGLPGSLATAGVLNVVVAALAWYVARSDAVDADVAAAPATVAVEVTDPQRARRLRNGLLGLAFGTAVASFIYEIVWIRMLSLVLGSATHAFEIMLSAFILGIALGALFIERRADRLDDPLGVLAGIQWLMGFAALATLPVYVASFSWTAGLVATVPATDAGYDAFNVARYGLALAVMLPSTFCAGMVLPLLTRLLVVAGGGERSVGWTYGVNTFGSIVGVGLAALLLLPLLGVKLLLILGAGLDMALGVLLLHLRKERSGRSLRVRGMAWGATVLVILGMGAATRLDPVLLSAGVFRTGRVPGTGAEVLFYEDGRTATVSVVESDEWRLIATNGKTDASVRVPRADGATDHRPLLGDEPTQLLLALLSLAYHDAPDRVAIVGQGSGVTSHYLLASPAIESLSTIEIEPEMIEGSRAFMPANRRVFEDPRSRFVLDDARSVLQSDPEPWDVILSEPSNPWVSGVSSLFTDEFYGTVRSRLADGGILVQWLQVYELSDELVLSVLAALHRHFPSYHVYRSTGDLMVVAGLDPTLPQPDWAVLELPGLQRDLRRVPDLSAAHLASLRVADRRVLAPLLDTWTPVNSDYRPVLDLEAERSRFVGDWASGLLFLGAGPLHVASPFLPPNRALAPGPPPFPEIRRTVGLALNRSLRAASEGQRLEELPGGEELADRFYALRRFRGAMAAGEGPGEWVRWTREAQSMVEWLHDGLTGVADQGVFDELNGYLAEVEAPREAWVAVDFLRDSHAWDFPGTVETGRILLDEARRGRLWVRPEILLDGLVTACLQVNDVECAREAFDTLLPLGNREPDDIRVRLLEAHIEAAEAHRP